MEIKHPLLQLFRLSAILLSTVAAHAAAPQITAQPISQTVLEGQNVTLSVNASGTAPLYFQWRRGTTNIGTGAAFMISNAAPVLTGADYSCVVTNSSGSVTSRITAITVLGDLDRDLMADVWELAYGLNPTNAADATLDPDMDGVINRIEFERGTHPVSAASVQSFLLGSSGRDGFGISLALPYGLAQLNVTNYLVTDGSNTLNVVSAVPGDSNNFVRVTLEQPLIAGHTYHVRVFSPPAVQDITSYTVNVPVGAEIPDNDPDGRASTITLNTPIARITDVNVTLTVSNGFLGDYYAYLVHDSGFAVLLNRPGTFAFGDIGYADSDLNVTFDDDAPNGDVHLYRLRLNGDHDVPLDGPLTNLWAPDGRVTDPRFVVASDPRTELLNSFNGLNPQGEWTLFIADAELGDIGTFVSWGLEVWGTVNRPPVALDNGMAIRAGTSGVIKVAKLLSNDSDPDNDPLSVVSVSSTSTNGGSVTLVGANVTYTPRPGFTGEDRFTYTITDGHGGFATAVVVVLVVGGDLPSFNQVAILSNGRGGFIIRFAGIPGYSYNVQRTPSLAPATWTTLAALTAPIHGIIEYEDTTPLPGSAYYRTEANSPVPPGTPETPFPPWQSPAAAPCNGCQGLAGSLQESLSPYALLYSGESQFSATHLHIQGVGLDFNWGLKYRSKATNGSSAVGAGWTSSYDLGIRHSGTNIELQEGGWRTDILVRQPNGTFAKDEMFAVGSFDVAGAFMLQFRDKSSWQFLALDGSAAQGRLSRITDRQGNMLRCVYDGNGRLATVFDTLNRPITIGYDTNGLIASVTDFIGRQVSYAYYQATDTGGGAGDLKSVTTPAVTGTPNTNDFPAGKTTLFTYTKGSSNPALDHQLLTVTDAKGQTWLENTYLVTAPSDFRFGRLAAQRWGGSNEVLMFTYVGVGPGSNNSFTVVKTIVNDRAGVVHEKRFDTRNRCVNARTFTGFAIPGLATTETHNRPQEKEKRRATDPEFFETSFEWNTDSLLTRVVHPNGNSEVNVYESALNPDASRQVRGNLRLRQEWPGPLGAAQPVREKRFDYDTNFNLLTRYVDARGNVTTHAYDGSGNRTNTVHPGPSIMEDFEYNAFGQMTAHTRPADGSGYRRRDTMQYYTNGPQRGYLQRKIIDASGLALTTTLFHDSVGNVVRVIDPRGKDTLFAVNALDQVVRETSRAVTNGGVRYLCDKFYDVNDNVIRTEVQNVDHLGVLQPNATFTTTFTYDFNDKLVGVTREVNPSNSVATAWVYDKNRNVSFVQFGEATAGRDSFNTVQYFHDERNFLFREILAPGSASQSTSQFDYDLNGNLTRKETGREGTPHVSQFAFDGYDQLVSAVDPMGNATTYGYDAGGNLLSERTDGELADAPGSAGNVRLSESAHAYDAFDRRVRTDVAYFDTATQAPIGDGFSTTEYFYSANSQLIRVRDDNGRDTVTAYDTANRRSVLTDARGNTTTYAYDANGNIISATEVDKSDLGSPDETFVTTYAYDNLDRRTQTTDNAGHTTAYAYDSRDNLALQTDALGRATRYDYDGLNRLIRTVRDMNGNGPNPAEAADIVTTQTWDASSRLISQADDNGHATTYAYDSLDRVIATTYADGTATTAAYDVHDNVVSSADANGSVTTSAYDLLNRLTAVNVTRAPGVLGTTAEQFQYDGLSRLVAAQDDDSLIMRAYNSLSLVTRETQQSLPGGPVSVVQSAFDGVGNQTALAYPGGRVIAQDYEPLDRLSLVRDDPLGANTTLASYRYFGPRVQRRDYGNGTRQDVAYDNLRRVIGTRHTVIAGGAAIDDRQYSWSAVNDQTSAQNLLAAKTRSYSYDDSDRLVGSQETGGPAITYTLDGVGNRQSVSGGAGAGVYQMNPAAPVPADFQVNQYTATPFDNRVYDDNGNLTGSGVLQLAYDYRNQLVKFTDPNAAQITTYQYDALGRRIAKNVAGVVTRFAYQAAHEIEEQDAAGATLATFVWGSWIDELLEMKRGGQRYFFHGDDKHSVMKVTDAAGNLAEQYEYLDYGAPSIFDGAGGPLLQSAIGNPHLFTGRRHDAETGLYYYRSRYLDSFTGRFITRDSIGIWGDPSGLGNGYTYVGNNPASRTDPEGTGDPVPGADVKLGKNPGGQGINIFGAGGAGSTISINEPGVKVMGFGIDEPGVKFNGGFGSGHTRGTINTTRSNIKNNAFTTFGGDHTIADPMDGQHDDWFTIQVGAWSSSGSEQRTSVNTSRSNIKHNTLWAGPLGEDAVKVMGIAVNEDGVKFNGGFGSGHTRGLISTTKSNIKDNPFTTFGGDLDEDGDKVMGIAVSNDGLKFNGGFGSGHTRGTINFANSLSDPKPSKPAKPVETQWSWWWLFL